MDKVKIELLAPAGNFDKLKTAFYFGADAVYCSGKSYGLRMAADNFDNEQLKEAIDYSHSLGKKIYITLNVIARECDFEGLDVYLQYLESIKPDALIIADIGIMGFAKKYAPSIPIHISTQANVTNEHTANAYVSLGASRIIPARELDLKEIKKLKASLPADVEVECFVHGSMCMAYSGRCIISDYHTNRAANSGMCTQQCRYEYNVIVKEKVKGNVLEVVEDDRGSYIFNSKDLNMIQRLNDLIDAGVTSFKIEGRVKSIYYVGCVVNAYKRALDNYYRGKNIDSVIVEELEKAGSRDSSTGLYYKENINNSICHDSAKPANDYEFVANCIETHNGEYAIVEMRNRFQVGDVLEVVSPNSIKKSIVIGNMIDENNQIITNVIGVLQKVKIYTDYILTKGDLLRKKKE